MSAFSPDAASRPGKSRWRLLLRALLFAFALSLGGLPAAAQDVSSAAPSEARHDAGPGVLELLPADAVTGHEMGRGDTALAYTATAGTLTLRNQQGARLAALFYTAYTKDGGDAATRPVTFVFNGGPGASSAYLHLGLVGPRIADFGPRPDAATVRLQDNADSWLRFTDLVLLDPIGTGWSRAADPEDSEKFWSVEQDAETLAKAIALYVADNARTVSPKYLLGESYGGFRAAKVAQALRGDQGLIVAGIVMVSPFLEGTLHFGQSRYPLNAALLLPSIAATELDRQGRFSAEALGTAEHFAMTDYLVTLAGPPLAGEAAESFYARVAQLSDLPVDVVARTRGFIGRAYLEHQSGDEAKVVSPYDGTFTAPDPFPASDQGSSDPILDGYLQALGGLFVGYAREELKFKTEMTYELLNERVSRKWEWNGGHGGRRSASAGDDLRELLTLDPGFRLLIAHGRSDLVTPYSVSRYLLDHLPQQIGPDRARLALYKGGHMFYFDPTSRAAFTAEAEAFYENRAPATLE